MTRTWNDLEGVSLAGRYWLKQCLTATENDAWFLTRFNAACDAAVRVARADAPAAEEQLEQWREAKGMDHPHIVRMLDAGRVVAEGTDVIFAVCEYPDDFLIGALAERPLSKAEARQVLDACLSALGFLHSRGLVHGAVGADHIMAFGERIKLPVDTIGHGGDPADDMWALGATLVEVLTRERPGPASDIPWVPEPFGTIVRQTMRHDPTQRWTVADVEAHLAPPEPATVPFEPAPEPEPEAELEPGPVTAAPAMVTERVRHGNAMKWVPLAGLIAAAALGALFLPHSKPPAAKPVETRPAPPPPVTTPQPPEKAVARRNPDAIWRVVVYEYAHRAAAEQRVRALNQKRPEFHAEVFAPRGNRAPYLVALGGFMTLAEAERLKRQARAAGMPRDTFVRNYRLK